MENISNLSLVELMVWMAKRFGVIMLSLGMTYVIVIMADPVVEAVGETILFLGSDIRKDFHSLAKLSLFFLGVLGFARLLLRNKR